MTNLDTTQLETDAGVALASVNSQIQNMRTERKNINVRLAELDLEKRRLTRIVNAFKPRPSRKAASNGGSE